MIHVTITFQVDPAQLARETREADALEKLVDGNVAIVKRALELAGEVRVAASNEEPRP